MTNYQATLSRLCTQHITIPLKAEVDHLADAEAEDLLGKHLASPNWKIVETFEADKLISVTRGGSK